MSTSNALARHVRGIVTGGNWTERDLQQELNGTDWGMATQALPGFNSIAALTWHVKYFIGVQLRVLRGGPLEGHDRLSWEMPSISDQDTWDAVVKDLLAEGDALADHVEQLSDAQLFSPFGDPKYGTYFSNLVGLVEHTHYHLGQIVLLKRLIGHQQA